LKKRWRRKNYSEVPSTQSGRRNRNDNRKRKVPTL
jgi:hypothetical protein